MSPSQRGPSRRPPPRHGSTGRPARAAGGQQRDASRADKRGLGGDQVEGRQAVRELLLGGRRAIREIWVLADADDRGPLQDLTDLAASLRVAVKPVSRGKLDGAARTEAPQGVIAFAAPLEEVELDRLAQGTKASPPFLIAVDGVTDPGNLGALLRSAECAGATGVILPRHRAVHITPAVTKAAAGAIEHLPMAVVGGLPAALTRLKELGVWVIGLDSEGARRIDQVELATEPVVLVLGAEGSGLSPLVRKRCDVVASIPLRGRLASLNVAAAAAIACYEVARRRLDAPGQS
jgi:23S rRNA (guanosine2251-2'-O)-methyltransferase